jgi:hypothetical protein
MGERPFDIIHGRERESRSFELEQPFVGRVSGEGFDDGRDEGGTVSDA